ncbi:MAG: hypothetical protein ABS871_07370 [Methanobrevibacter sp.]
MSLNEQKEKLSLKHDERKLKFEEKKAQAKINREERKIKRKEAHINKKIESHIEKAINKIYKAEEDAEDDINKLLSAADEEIELDEKPVELVIFKTQNKLEEILLNAELKMQKAKNELIKNFEKDMEDVMELASIEDDLEVFKDEMDEVSTLLSEKIDIEKEIIALNSKD